MLNLLNDSSIIFSVTQFVFLSFSHECILHQRYILPCYPFPKQALVFTCLQYKSFQNTVGKGEIARNEQFLIFPLCFSNCFETFLLFSSIFELPSANSFSLEVSKICRLGKGYCINIAWAKDFDILFYFG